MQFIPLSTISLELPPKLMWILYSDQTSSFVIGDDQAAFAVRVSKPDAPAALQGPSAKQSHNLPVQETLSDELADEPWHGFHFVPGNVRPPDGDLLRTLVFGPDYGTCFLHQASGLVLRLRAGSMELFESDGNELTLIDKTRTRGRSVLAFAAHRTQNLIAYGDNDGTFHIHRFDKMGFNKASKIADKQRKASRVEFVRDGTMLVIGGMGYLTALSNDDSKFVMQHEISLPVRDFIWRNYSEIILVNQGMHGIAGFRYGANGFEKLTELKSDDAVQQIAISKCNRYLAASFQDSAKVSVYEIKSH